MMKSIINTMFEMFGGVKPSSYATFGVIENCYTELNCYPELQNNYPEPSRHPEFISGSYELRKCNINVNILKLLYTLIVGKMLWKTRHFSRNQKISEKVVKQVRNDMKDQVQHDIKERNNSNKTTERNSEMNIIKNIQKAVAFTLAETLVVMGIIGVVAALTIPNLNQSTGNRETVTKLKKVYANLEDAFGRATAVYGPVGEWSNGMSGATSLEKSERFATRMADFMKISKDCGETLEGCFSSGQYYYLDGDYLDGVESEEYGVLLADGTALRYYIGDFESENTIGAIKVDLDGPKGSNTAGKDFFKFYITPSGIYPDGSQKDLTDELLTGTCFSSGMRCAGWVIETGNMDYLKATEGTCPNGTELSWENTSCK